MQRITRSLGILFILNFILSFQGSAQTVTIRGQVIDNETRYALAFVTIQINDGPEGCISDIDGRFTVVSSVVVKKLKISYIGYQSLEYVPENYSQNILIRMEKTAYELSEVIIKPGKNPAHRIISQVLANRHINDHEHLASFSYTSYEKTVFGPESDSIPPIDSLLTDPSYLKIKEFFRNQHLFIMESTMIRSFKFPSENYNKVIASRVSGFSDPLFVYLISQVQSTTFYKDVIKIFDKDYINPVSNGSFNKYYFEIQDTLVEPPPYDTTYIISYRPLLNTNFDGLKGSISISTNGYAIRNVIASPTLDQGVFSVKIQQMYDYIDSTHWFPVQLNTDLIVKKGQIAIDSSNQKTLKMMGRGKSYISNINLNPGLKRSQFGVFEVDVQPDAYDQPEEVWNKYRVDSLTERELKTYQFMDSLGKAKNFDRLSRKLNTMMTGTVTVRYIDFYLENLFMVNRHEGARLGLKVANSDKLSNWFKIGAYGAYGFKDKQWKYGFDGSVIINRFRNARIKAGFYDDVDEAGADDIFGSSRNPLNPERYRDIMIIRMDHTLCYKAGFSSRILKYLTVGPEISVYKRTPLYNYSYRLESSGNISVGTSDFSFTEISVEMRYAFGEKYMKNINSTMSLGTRYPILQFYASHGFNGMFGGQYVYNRFDLKISKSFFIKYLGTTSFTIHAGLIDRDIPYVNLYNAKAAFRTFNLYSPGSFATMRMDEFTSDRYASIFLSHSFGTLLFRSRYFNPVPELVTNIGIGTLRHPENHLKEGIKSFEKGYFESGIILNKIIGLGITDIGLGWFYRYGPYALPTTKENMAWKIAIEFMF